MKNKSIFDEEIEKRLKESRYTGSKKESKQGRFEKLNTFVFIMLAIAIMSSLIITLLKIFK